MKNAHAIQQGDKNIFDNWLNERRELLILYSAFADQKKDTNGELSRGKSLQAFCETLIDYVSAGHFGVYEELVKQSRLDPQYLAHHYAQITQTTEIALQFNDKYQSKKKSGSNEDYENDLSMLGEALAIRLELEDQMLGATR